MTITEKKKESIKEICKEYFSINGFEKELNELFDSLSKKELNPQSIQKELNDVLNLIQDESIRKKIINKIEGLLLKEDMNVDQINEVLSQKNQLDK